MMRDVYSVWEISVDSIPDKERWDEKLNFKLFFGCCQLEMIDGLFSVYSILWKSFEIWENFRIFCMNKNCNSYHLFSIGCCC